MSLFLRILYEDNHVLVVDKPAGLLSQRDTSGDLDVLTLAREIIKERDAKPGKVYLGLVHRLDRPVAGVMILAKTSKAASRLSEQFRSRKTRKIYRAVVEGTPSPSEATLVHRLRKEQGRRITLVVPDDEPGKRAELVYRTMETRCDKTLLEIELVTGLPHQIRAQLSAVGCPVIGDAKYGARTSCAPGRIALFAHAITFGHPTQKVPVTVATDPPEHWPF